MKLGSFIHLEELKVNPMFNFASYSTFYGSLTFVEFFAFRSFSQKLLELEP